MLSTLALAIILLPTYLNNQRVVYRNKSSFDNYQKDSTYLKESAYV
jgi:hypothetical protein